MQVPFNPKDWATSIPAWLIAFGFLTYVGVWAIKQLGLAKDKKIAASGELPPEHWYSRFEEINEKLDRVKQQLHDFLLIRHRDINDIKEAEGKILSSVSDLVIEVAQLTSEIRTRRVR